MNDMIYVFDEVKRKVEITDIANPPEWYDLIELLPEAYAVFDSVDNSLTFFRDDEDKYTQGQIEGTKTYYIGIEENRYIEWYDKDIETVIFKDTISPISTAYWFGSMYSLSTIIGIEKLDTSNVTNMSGMFSDCSSLTTLNVSHFDTSSVTSMLGMFIGCSSLTALDASHFDTSSVTDMNNMFYDCSSLTTLDVSHFDTSSVTDMGSMFYGCSSLTTTFNIMNMPQTYTYMCRSAATVTGAQITLKYISPVTSANIDDIVATKWSSSSNVINGGEGTFVPPTPPV